MNQQELNDWTRDLVALIERRAQAARDAQTLDDHLEVLRIHQAIEDAHAKFFGPQVHAALRAGASWPQVRIATGWDEAADLYLDWGHAQFGSRSPEQLSEVKRYVTPERTPPAHHEPT